MNFFEALRERAAQTLVEPWVSYEDLSINARDGMDATIEALKEMMVGEPMTRPIHHVRGSSWFVPGLSCISGEEIGTAGEEVVVMVFKCEKKD